MDAPRVSKPMSGNGVPSSATAFAELTQRWTEATQRAIGRSLKTAQTAFSAFDPSEQASYQTGHTLESTLDEPNFAHEGWVVEQSVDDRDALGVGDFVRFTKTLSYADGVTFAHSSGDTNPLHLEEAFADETRFGGRILHGSLVSGTISAALARLPGLIVYLSQTVEFRAPVTPGEAVTAECRIVEALGDDRYRLSTVVYNEDEDVVIDGEAVVLVDDHPDV